MYLAHSLTICQKPVIEQQFRGELREDEEHLREGSVDDDATHARSAGELSAKVDLGALKMLMLRAKVARQVVVVWGRGLGGHHPHPWKSQSRLPRQRSRRSTPLGLLDSAKDHHDAFDQNPN
jgi:hypothetical protein